MKSFLFLPALMFVMSVSGAALALKPADPAPDLAAEVGLVPHKALYEISLHSAKSGSQIVDIKGQMVYEWQPSCDAWISNHKFNLTYDYADSPSMRIKSDFSLYEPFGGRSLSFSSQRKRNGLLFEELRGEAEVAADDSEVAGTAIYTRPDGLELELPGGTVFPMGHSLGLLKGIRENKTFYRAVMFDGSDKEGPVEVNAFIGKAVTGVKAKFVSLKAVDQELLDSPSRNVRMAFYPLQSGEEVADYEMSLVFHENGVISDMLIEYGDFSVKQRLLAATPLESTCDATPRKTVQDE